MNSFHIGNAWHPKNGVAANIMGAVFLSVLVSCLFLFVLQVFGQDAAAPVNPPMAPVAGSGGPEFDATGVVLQILPLFLATLSPFMTQGLRALMKTAASSVSPKIWGVVTMLLGTVVPALAAVVGETNVAMAAGGGAAISGVSWGLKQGKPVVEPATAGSSPATAGGGS